MELKRGLSRVYCPGFIYAFLRLGVYGAGRGLQAAWPVVGPPLMWGARSVTGAVVGYEVSRRGGDPLSVPLWLFGGPAFRIGYIVGGILGLGQPEIERRFAR